MKTLDLVNIRHGRAFLEFVFFNSYGMFIIFIIVIRRFFYPESHESLDHGIFLLEVSSLFTDFNVVNSHLYLA